MQAKSSLVWQLPQAAGGTHLNGFGYPQIERLARDARVADEGPENGTYAAEFVQRVGLARGLWARQASAARIGE